MVHMRKRQVGVQRRVDAGGAPLPGAEIVDRGTGRRVVSNTQGEFILNGVSGRVELDVRYIGLPSVSQTVVATPGRLTSVTVTLGEGARPLVLQQFEAVTVTGAEAAGCVLLPGDGARYLVIGQTDSAPSAISASRINLRQVSVLDPRVYGG